MNRNVVVLIHQPCAQLAYIPATESHNQNNGNKMLFNDVVQHWDHGNYCLTYMEELSSRNFMQHVLHIVKRYIFWPKLWWFPKCNQDVLLSKLNKSVTETIKQATEKESGN